MTCVTVAFDVSDNVLQSVPNQLQCVHPIIIVDIIIITGYKNNRSRAITININLVSHVDVHILSTQ